MGKLGLHNNHVNHVADYCYHGYHEMIKVRLGCLGLGAVSLLLEINHIVLRDQASLSLERCLDPARFDRWIH